MHPLVRGDLGRKTDDAEGRAGKIEQSVVVELKGV